MLDTIQVEEALRNIGNFLGVFPKDKLPPESSGTSCTFIVNTDSSNLPGQHWIAVYVRTSKEGFVFDSFGQSPPLQVQHWMNIRGISWTCNMRQVQSHESTLCGAYCIYFIWFATSNSLKDELFVNILRILFPMHATLKTNDLIVKNFMDIAYPNILL